MEGALWRSTEKRDPGGCGGFEGGDVVGVAPGEDCSVSTKPETRVATACADKFGIVVMEEKTGMLVTAPVAVDVAGGRSVAFVAVTVSDSVCPTSPLTGVYVDDVAPEIGVETSSQFHW